MTMMLQAPHPSPNASSILPNPQLGDSENLKNTLDIHRSMTGVMRTYVIDPGISKFVYNFRLSRMKALELQEFVRAYSGVKWIVTDYQNISWVVVLQNNPFELTAISRGQPGRELVNVTLELEGVRL